MAVTAQRSRKAPQFARPCNALARKGIARPQRRAWVETCGWCCCAPPAARIARPQRRAWVERRLCGEREALHKGIARTNVECELLRREARLGGTLQSAPPAPSRGYFETAPETMKPRPWRGLRLKAAPGLIPLHRLVQTARSFYSVERSSPEDSCRGTVRPIAAPSARQPTVRQLSTKKGRSVVEQHLTDASGQAGLSVSERPPDSAHVGRVDALGRLRRVVLLALRQIRARV